MPDNHGGQTYTTHHTPHSPTDTAERNKNMNTNTNTPKTAERPDFEQVKRNYETALASGKDSTQELTRNARPPPTVKPYPTTDTTPLLSN